MENYSQILGDSIIDKFFIDFNEKIISFTTTRYMGSVAEKREVNFTGVVQQDFRMFNKYNIIFGLVETDWDGLNLELPELMSLFQHYKSISQDDMRRIENKSLKCFLITASSGLDGYIIAERVEIKEITVDNN